MTLILEENVNRLVMPKWQTLLSHSKRAVRKGNNWDTRLEYKFENGDNLTMRAELRDGDKMLPCYAGFELLRVIESDLDRPVEEISQLVSRKIIVGWLFEGWAPAIPITLSGLVPNPASQRNRYSAIKHPDGKVEPTELGYRSTMHMRLVPADALFADEEEWLAAVKAARVAEKDRERAFETGKDADGNPTCQQFFGGCPTCGQSWILNVGRSHWGVCHTHKAKWPIGSNLFSDWRYETEADWQANSDRMAEYTEVARLGPGDTIPEPVSNQLDNGSYDAMDIDVVAPPKP